MALMAGLQGGVTTCGRQRGGHELSKHQLSDSARARAPGGDQQAQVGTVDETVAGDVGGRVVGTPGRDHETEVGTIHDAVAVHITGATVGR